MSENLYIYIYIERYIMKRLNRFWLLYCIDESFKLSWYLMRRE